MSDAKSSGSAPRSSTQTLMILPCSVESIGALPSTPLSRSSATIWSRNASDLELGVGDLDEVEVVGATGHPSELVRIDQRAVEDRQDDAASAVAVDAAEVRVLFGELVAVVAGHERGDCPRSGGRRLPEEFLCSGTSSLTPHAGSGVAVGSGVPTTSFQRVATVASPLPHPRGDERRQHERRHQLPGRRHVSSIDARSAEVESPLR